MTRRTRGAQAGDGGSRGSFRIIREGFRDNALDNTDLSVPAWSVLEGSSGALNPEL